MEVKPSLKRNMLALLIMQIINYSIPLITLPYLTRTLGSEQYGALNVALSLIQYGVIFVTFGFNLSATQLIAKYRSNALIISRVFWETMVAKLMLLCIACVVLLIITLNVEKFYEIRWLIFIFFLQLLSVAIDPLWFFQGIERLQKVSLFSALLRIVNIPLLIILVHTSDDVERVAFIQSGICLAIVLLSLAMLYKMKIIVLLKYMQLKIRKALINSTPFFIGAAAISLYNTSTPLILGLVNTYEQVGIYSASFKIQGAVIGVFTILGQAIYPRVNNLFHKEHPLGYLFVKKIILIIFPLLIIGSVLYYFIVPTIVVWALGNQFEASKITLEIMSPMLFLTPFCIVFAHYLLLPLGYKNVYLCVPIVIGVLHIIYSSIFSYYWGAVGASYSILLTEFLSFITLLTLVCYLTEIRQYFKQVKSC